MSTPSATRNDANSQMDDGDDNDPKRPFYRSPFFWGFIFGAVVLTMLRPFTRKIPDPPEIGLQLPELTSSEVVRVSGAVQPSATIRHSAPADGVMVLTVVAGTCEDACLRALEVASSIQRRMSRTDVRSQFVTLASQTVDKTKLVSFASEFFPYASDWRLFAIDEPGALAAVLDARGEDLSERSLTTIASEGYLWIVDSSGHLRGRYDSGASDVESEVYHRSLRILGRY